MNSHYFHVEDICVCLLTSARRLLLQDNGKHCVLMQTLPCAFLYISQSLKDLSMRTDYRQRLLTLCSDVGLATEAKEGRYEYFPEFICPDSHVLENSQITT